MTLIGFGLNLLLAGLLVAALVIGVRLNRRLAALRDSHDSFAKAVSELDTAARRAEQGLADLRAATDEAVDLLGDRIEKGRALAAKLDRQLTAAPADAAPAMLNVEQRLGSLLAAAREARAQPERLVRPEPRVRRAPPAVFSDALSDDDLFEDEPLTLDRFAAARAGGARR